MAKLSGIEIQSLRHLIGDEQLSATKAQSYAQNATDPKLKDFFNKEAKQAQANAQDLLKFLD